MFCFCTPPLETSLSGHCRIDCLFTESGGSSASDAEESTHTLLSQLRKSVLQIRLCRRKHAVAVTSSRKRRQTLLVAQSGATTGCVLSPPAVCFRHSCLLWATGSDCEDPNIRYGEETPNGVVIVRPNWKQKF